MYKKVYDKNKGIFIYVDAQTGASAPYELYAQTGEEIIHGKCLSSGDSISCTGIFDTLTKLFSSSVASSIGSAGKKALETAGKAVAESPGRLLSSALESGTKKIGTQVGNLAAAKLTEKIKSLKKNPLRTLVLALQNLLLRSSLQRAPLLLVI